MKLNVSVQSSKEAFPARGASSWAQNWCLARWI